MPPTVRKGQAPPPHSRDTFRKIFFQSFYDPAFDPERAAIDRLEAIAWDAYQEGRKAPRTRKAGPAFPIPITTCRWSGSRLANGCRKPRPVGRTRSRRPRFW
jgi:hypothetical protein